MNYTEQELYQLIEDVKKEFSAELAKSEGEAVELESSAVVQEGEVLVKNEEEPKEHKEPKEEPKEEKSPEAPMEAKEEEKPEAKEEPKEEGHGYDEEDLEHMHKMYQSMSKAELIAHHDSVKKALDGHMEKCGEMTQEAPMAKSEEVNAASEVSDLLKSEIAHKDAKIEELQKTLEVASQFISKLAEKKTAPVGKAITSMNVIAKSEQVQEEKVLTKSEIDAILSKKIADPSLSKTDRQAINSFYLDSKGINSISHLLKQ